MPRRFHAAAFLVVATALPAPLLAADLGDSYSGPLKDAPIAAAPYSWSGPYIGVHGGYGWGNSSIRDGGTNLYSGTGNKSIPPYGAFSCGPALTGNYCNTPFELDPKGWLGGMQLGANWQQDHLVLGIEGDLGYLGVSNDYVLIRPFNDRDYGSVEYGFYGTATGRLGYAFDRSLVYAKGGLALAHIEDRGYDLDLKGGSFQKYQGSEASKSGTETGWVLGGGIEHALSDRLTLKAEYLYMDFGSATSRSSDGDIYKYDNQLHTAKIGLNYRLSSEPEPLK